MRRWLGERIERWLSPPEGEVRRRRARVLALTSAAAAAVIAAPLCAFALGLLVGLFLQGFRLVS